MPDLQGDIAAAAGSRKFDLRRYFAREPVMLAFLTLLAVVFFGAVTALSHLYHAQQESLGNRWFIRGTADLQQKNFEGAVSEFRAALRYSRDSYAYQSNLAEALLGLNRTAEANAYLINLWDREPENGLVNLELARLAAREGDREEALRYYHNAIYATWLGNQEVQRRDTRLELIEYLMSISSRAQAQAELIALAANLPDDATQQARTASLFLQTQDYEHALSEYGLSLREQPQDLSALAGAGKAAFELGHYSLAQHYLRTAVSLNASDAVSAGLLKTAEIAMQMDPFQWQLSAAQRNPIVIEAFAAAGQRLASCAAAKGAKAPAPTASSSPISLAESWEQLKPRISERGLQRDPDLINTAMELVFAIERETNSVCGAPSGRDEALLVIAKLHESN